MVDLLFVAYTDSFCVPVWIFSFCLKFFITSESKDSVICETGAQSLSVLFMLMLQYFNIWKGNQKLASYLKYFVPPEFFLNRNVYMPIMREILKMSVSQNADIFSP